MYEHFTNFLRSFKYVKLSLTQLEAQAPADASYSQFAEIILKLMDDQFLSAVASHGDNHKVPPLPLTYRIHKAALQQSVKQQVHTAQYRVHSSIRLDVYLKHSMEVWEQDWPYIQKVSEFLRDHEQGLEIVSIPERSFQLVGDEKWIDEKAGRKLLERIGVWDLLKMNTNPDPLMFSCNPHCMSNKAHLHLIVENKTTFLALEPILNETPFTTLIYGSGWKIVSNIDRLPKQLHLPHVDHRYFYFGDLDYEGIAIWRMLHDRIQAIPAAAFYSDLLQKSFVKGKATQKPQMDALKQFGKWFTPLENERLKSMLENGCYLPQEALSISELCRIWRNAEWMTD